FPWVQTLSPLESSDLQSLVRRIESSSFDACVIFSVYSQNSLPAALVAYLAGIPLRLAYCRENPYDLLTHWLPDKEPYSFILHQVERDLKLVEFIGARTENKRLSLHIGLDGRTVNKKIQTVLIDFPVPYFVLHPG